MSRSPRFRGRTPVKFLHSHLLRSEALERREMLSAAALDDPLAIGLDGTILAGTMMTGTSDTTVMPMMDHGGHDGHIVSDDPTADFVRLQHDVIPNFVQHPTVVSIGSGNWFNPAIWSTGRVPGAGDIVQIQTGNTVRYNGVSDVPLDSVGVNPGGKLEFATDRNTRMRLSQMLVFEGGHVQIGTAAQPVQAGYSAEIVIRDTPLDLMHDPGQYGTGIICVGKFEVYGTPMARTWLRLAAEPRAGDNSLLLEAVPSGWKAGDTLIIPDSRQVPSNQVQLLQQGSPLAPEPHWEEVVIQRIEGNRVFLSAPIAYDHPGARNAQGQLELLPHVAVLDRNVTVRSENPEGTRGHVMFGYRADVDVNYARFKDLGRTDAFRPLDNTTTDMHGNATHVGINQIGRYSFHMHMVMGPENHMNTGYQFRIVGNTIDGGRRWGVVVHNSHWGLIQDNVAYDLDGSAFVTQDGSETGNEFIRNFAMRVQGTGIDGENGTQVRPNDVGRGGVGFWFRRPGSLFVDNVAVNNSFAGVVITSARLETVVIPVARGMDDRLPGQGRTISATETQPITNNEMYGWSSFGFWTTWPTSYSRFYFMPDTVHFDRLTVWHTYTAGIFIASTNNVLLTNSVVLGSAEAMLANDKARPALGLRLSDSANLHFRADGLRIENMKVGIRMPTGDMGGSNVGEYIPMWNMSVTGVPTIVENTKLANYINVEIASPHNVSRGIEMRNLDFEPSSVARLSGDLPSQNVYMNYTGRGQLLVPDSIRLLDLEGDPTADYRLYFNEQRPDFVVPLENPALNQGAPFPGMTNLDLWNYNGQAIGGAITPFDESGLAGAVWLPGINAPAYGLELLVGIEGAMSFGRTELQEFVLTAHDTSLWVQPSEFTFRIDWNGDGAVDETVVGPSGTVVSRAFHSVQATTIQVWADYAGLQSDGPAQLRVFPLPYLLVPDEADGDQWGLIWYGTDGEDRIRLESIPGGVRLHEERVNSQTVSNVYQLMAPVSVVIAMGFGGDDYLDARGLQVPVHLFGLDGNDILIGGSANSFIYGGAGNDILIGGDGNDVLYGNAGMDILVGGLGTDLLYGGDQDDVLIAGKYNAPNDVQSLRELRDVWTGGGTYLLRLFAIRGMSHLGLIGGTSQLQNDQAIDLLYGGSGTDLFFWDDWDLIPDLAAGESRTRVV